VPALVLGETPRAEREAILSACGRGTIDTIVRVGVLVEGWNAPECKLLPCRECARHRSSSA
jgi:superfamily II DNA or RNA helicase